MSMRPDSITLESVTATAARHAAVYRLKPPSYQRTMLNDLLCIWNGPHRRLLDIGGGTGIVAQCMADLSFAERVEAVDVVNRYSPGLDIATHVFDGQHLPFKSGSFDGATINNVIHHVSRSARVALLREVRRVVSGSIYIKDHVTACAWDHVRLTLLDLIGNLPFGGMVRASYLSADDWTALAEAAGYKMSAATTGSYRSGVYAALFPNRLERTMRWDPA